ncbi:MAG: class I SAM-dependent DNA methyltransferase [Lentisphaerae bacterium]|nr:class I SAM-dependent DNA methyltransferase [Lentisphaerota bacterium]
MNAVEIEESVSRLAEQPFDAESFPYAFLESFGNKPATIQRLRSGSTNQSDIGGVLQRSNIHIKTSAPGEVAATLKALRESPKTASHKAKFILATDGIELQAESLEGEGETLACDYPEFADHFGFFLPLAGISTVRQIRENAFDIKATGRLNRLYIELLKDNPDWATAARRVDMNHFMARVIFCFFAEDTAIFQSDSLFTSTVEKMSARDSSNTHEVISELFRAMNTRRADRERANIKSWANDFPYVNGGLFSDSVDVPRFSKIARSYLLHVGNLDWTKINPDIFGSMIQAVADDEERGALGMHYTSVPNILKVLNPLFLDDLRAKLEEAGDNTRKLLNLRNRISRIRVFDPACGSGNFLVIAYKEMRAIEAEINKRRGEADRRSDIPLTNFRGIEIRSFSCEIARLALIIAEYQCDVLYRGQQLALAEFLPLEAANWITCGNALRLDWLSLCPPTGKGVKNRAEDLFDTPLDQAEIDFENEGGETYICGNPPYLGSTWQSADQKSDLKGIFDGKTKSWKSLDYVSGWFMKAAEFGRHTESAAAFVSTNSICQGQQVPILWPIIFETGHEIHFAHTSFKWANLASHNAGVTVAIVGISRNAPPLRSLYVLDESKATVCRKVEHINAYLVSAPHVIVEKISKPLCGQSEMSFGNKPVDGGHLLLSPDEVDALGLSPEQRRRFIRRIYGSAEFIRGIERYVLWIEDTCLNEAESIHGIRKRIEGVRETRLSSPDKSANEMAKRAHQMREMNIGVKWTITVPRTSSENRPSLPAGIIDSRSTVTSETFALYDAPLWNMALIASKLHLVWIGTVCGKLKTDFRYSNTLGWNTFPVPPLTERNKAELTRCAEDILLAREAHFPATIADLYDPDKMPANLRAAHERNDETLERIYIGRRFKNDTERLEKLFELYTRMTANAPAKKVSGRRKV